MSSTPATLRFFLPAFFSDQDEVNRFLAKLTQEVRQTTDSIERSRLALSHAVLLGLMRQKKLSEYSRFMHLQKMPIPGLADFQIQSIHALPTVYRLDPLVEIKFKLAEAELLQLAASIQQEESVLRKALELLNEIPEQALQPTLLYEFLKLKGECLLDIYNHVNFEGTDFETYYTYYSYLLEARYCFSRLVEAALEGKILPEAPKLPEVILHYARTLTHLNRLAEPFYSLQSLKTANFKDSSLLIRTLLFEAIRKYTCDSTNPLLLLRESDAIKKALRSPHIDKRNSPFLHQSQIEVTELLQQYEAAHGMGSSDLCKIRVQVAKAKQQYDEQTKFLLKHNLLLNEHALYCECERGVKDNLVIPAGCKHTHTAWVMPWRQALEQIKLTYIEGRNSLVRYEFPEKGYSYQSDFIHEDIVISLTATQLVQAFKSTFSALDKIASTCNELLGTNEKRVYFHTYFSDIKVLKKIFDLGDNEYLLALHSIALDLGSADKSWQHLVSFPDYKVWRNDAEHNQLWLVRENANIDELRQKSLTVGSYIREAEFKKKTIQLLQLCRSAIFAYVWFVRRTSRHHKEEWEEK